MDYIKQIPVSNGLTIKEIQQQVDRLKIATGAARETLLAELRKIDWRRVPLFLANAYEKATT
ncbi:MAG: hypothetical protein KGJ90_07360 [Patescibacteria group bacterium]|nr:hypothetical protein [Patescibacteria group bacterium]